MVARWRGVLYHNICRSIIYGKSLCSMEAHNNLSGVVEAHTFKYSHPQHTWIILVMMKFVMPCDYYTCTYEHSDPEGVHFKHNTLSFSFARFLVNYNRLWKLRPCCNSTICFAGLLYVKASLMCGIWWLMDFHTLLLTCVSCRSHGTRERMGFSFVWKKPTTTLYISLKHLRRFGEKLHIITEPPNFPSSDTLGW